MPSTAAAANRWIAAVAVAAARARVFYVAEALNDLLLVADAAWLVQAMGRPGTA
jgi:hypothetical protein